MRSNQKTLRVSVLLVGERFVVDMRYLGHLYYVMCFMQERTFFRMLSSPEQYITVGNMFGFFHPLSIGKRNTLLYRCVLTVSPLDCLARREDYTLQKEGNMNERVPIETGFAEVNGATSSI